MLEAFRDLLDRTDMDGGWILRADEVDRWPQSAIRWTVELGLLCETSRAQSVPCRECANACVVEPDVYPVQQSGRLRGYYFCRDEIHGGPIAFDEEEFRRWALRPKRLAHLVGKQLGFSETPAVVEHDRIYLLGAIATGGGPVDLFLAIGMGLPDVRYVVEKAERLHRSRCPVVIVPSTLPPPEFWPAKTTAISLAEHLRWDEEAETIDLLRLKKILRSLSPLARGTEWLTVRQCAELFLNDLPFLDVRRAAARISKAASAGHFATNGKTRNDRRVERTSFDAWRLAQRDRELDRE